MMKTEVKGLVYYLSLPYRTILRRDEEGDVIARIEELPGCISHGGDEAEALSNLASMKQLWLEDSIAAGEEIPEPQAEEPLPSGKWVQRVPRSLHAKLVRMAKTEGVSLNQLVTSMLSEQISPRTIQKALELMVGGYAAVAVHRSPACYWAAPVPLQEGWVLGSHPSNVASLPSLRKLIPGIEAKVEYAPEIKKQHLTTCR